MFKFRSEMLQRGCGFTVIPMGGIKGLNPTGVWCSVRFTPSPNRKTMKNSTKSSEYALEYEYYYDYVDPVFVNASALKYNRCEPLSLLHHRSADVTSNCLSLFRFNCPDSLDHSSCIYRVLLLDFVIYITLGATTKVRMKKDISQCLFQMHVHFFYFKNIVFVQLHWPC